MEDYQLIGVSHKNANVDLLSLLSLIGRRRESFLAHMGRERGFDGFVLSTCNRTEVYFKGPETAGVLAAWAAAVGLARLPEQKLYYKAGFGLLTHLFRVACGLDSKITGDNEIIGQLKETFLFQKTHGRLGGLWEKMVNASIECSRRIRKETNLNKGSISTPYHIARIIQKERKIAGNRILLVGAGEMIALSLKYLTRLLPEKRLVLTNRSIGKARTLALENGAGYFHFSLLETEMPQFQTIISAIQVEQPLFTSNYLNPVRPNLVFDLGVPCNFSKEGLDQACYYDMDTIAAYTKQATSKREADMEKAERIVSAQVREFAAWHDRRLYYQSTAAATI